MTARLGTTKCSTREPGRVYIDVMRDNFYVHPEFSMEKRSNDIALIELPYEVEFSHHIQSADMPTTCETPKPGEAAVVMGYGGKSKTLRFASLKTHSSHLFCDVFKFVTWDDSLICAFDINGNHSTSEGDSGSPLLMPSNNTLIGVLSFGASGKATNGFFYKYFIQILKI